MAAAVSSIPEDEMSLIKSLVHLMYTPMAVECLRTAVQMNILEELPKAPDSCDSDKVAVKLGLNPEVTLRLLRAVTMTKTVLEVSKGAFGLTEMGALLLNDHRPSLRGALLLEGDIVLKRGWEHLEEMVRAGCSPGDLSGMERAYGADWMNMILQQSPVHKSNFGKTFGDGMASWTSLEVMQIQKLYDFSNVASLADVGGGHGLLLCSILANNPSIQRGYLFDVEAILSESEYPKLMGVADRVELVAGDFFSTQGKIMPVADVYILKRILHDWHDEECVTILRNIYNSAQISSRVIHCGLVAPEIFQQEDVTRVADIQLMVVTHGRERTEEEIQKLFEKAGWQRGQCLTDGLLTVVEGIKS